MRDKKIELYITINPYPQLEKNVSVPAEDREILYDFINESNEMLSTVEDFFDREGENLSVDALQASFRLFHSVKGSAGFLGLNYLFYVARTGEKFLDLLRSDSLPWQSEYFSLVQDLCTFFRFALQRIVHENSDDFLVDSSRQLIEKIHAVTGMKTVESGEPDFETLETFVWEVDDLLAAAEQEFVLWDDVAGDKERLTILYRILHRLKGNFSLYGFDDLMQLSQAMESLLDRYLDGEVFQGGYPEKAFLQAIDAMRDAVASLVDSGQGDISEQQSLLDGLHSIMRIPLGKLLIKAGFVGVDTLDHALQVQENARIQKEPPQRLGEVLVAMGEVTKDQVRQALTQQEKKGKNVSAERNHSNRQKEEVPRVAEDILVRRDILVDTERMQCLQNLVSQLPERVEACQGVLNPSMRAFLDDIYTVSQTLQKAPVRLLCPLLNRVVHDLAHRSGKKVYFTVVGEDVELDREILNNLCDPLVHLLRNGIDHGIESPALRFAEGKKELGQLTLFILRRPEEVWVSVEDDGSGLDVKKIVARGVRHGFIDPRQQRPDSRQIASLIFQLGFTTADQVTDYSGRGVGMDAVKRSLRKLGGKVDVFSRPGKGTRITLRIPA